MNVSVSYEQRCPFCNQLLVSQFWDDLERHIMACREMALPEKRGELADLKERITKPESCENEERRNLAYTARRRDE